MPLICHLLQKEAKLQHVPPARIGLVRESLSSCTAIICKCLHHTVGGRLKAQQLQVEVLPRSLYLLIPMIPARTAERSRANLLAFKPRSLVVASRQRSPQNAMKILENQ